MSILEKIVSAKKSEIEEKRRQIPLEMLREKGEVRKGVFLAKGSNTVQIIAEIKRASPSKGLFAPDLDVEEKIGQYQAGGADAVSILTDFPFFQGTSDDFHTARTASSLPLLRKDFIIDQYQLYESCQMKADAILLIVRILDEKQLLHLYETAVELGLVPVVEIYSAEDIEKIAPLKESFIGVNNRNLADFTVALDNVLRMAEKVDASNHLISFSGISSPADVHYLFTRGIHSFLIGEYLAKAENARQKIEEMKRV